LLAQKIVLAFWLAQKIEKKVNENWLKPALTPLQKLRVSWQE
jgi:hypothetical protein